MNAFMKTSLSIAIIALLALLMGACAGPKKPAAMNESFHLPAGKGDLETVKAKLATGTPIDSKDRAGQTALMYAAETGRLAVVKHLIEHGADANAQTGTRGRGTALIYAAGANRIAVMGYLLDHGGADINATSHKHETALFWATAFGRAEAVNLLLSKNANTAIKNTDGKTALDVAQDLNRSNIVRILADAKIKDDQEQLRKEFGIAQKTGEQRLLAFIEKHPDSEYSDEASRSVLRIGQISKHMKSKGLTNKIKIGMPRSRVRQLLGNPQSSAIRLSNMNSRGDVGTMTRAGIQETWLYCDDFPKDLPYCGAVVVIVDSNEVVTGVSSGSAFYPQQESVR